MTKDEILSAAESLFFGKRQADVKLSSVARELGIQTPSLYHWFADKRTLLEWVIEFSAKKIPRGTQYHSRKKWTSRDDSLVSYLPIRKPKFVWYRVPKMILRRSWTAPTSEQVQKWCIQQTPFALPCSRRQWHARLSPYHTSWETRRRKLYRWILSPQSTRKNSRRARKSIFYKKTWVIRLFYWTVIIGVISFFPRNFGRDFAMSTSHTAFILDNNSLNFWYFIPT